MLDHCSFFCSPSYSYLVNYQIQSQIYNLLDEYTEETEYLTSSGMGVWCVSNVITTIARVVGVAEVFIKGTGVFLSAPYTNNCIHNAKLGLNEIFVHTTKNILRTTCIPIDFFLGSIFIFIEPKSFTKEMAECMRVNLLHAERGTLHSDMHQNDLMSVSGVVKPDFMAYQGRRFERLRAKKNI